MTEAGAASAARQEAARQLAGTLVNIGLLIGLSLLIEHRAQLGARARAAVRRVRRPAPPVDELQVSEFTAQVSAWEHEQRGTA